MTAEPAAPFAWGELLDRCMGRPDLAKRVLARFVEQAAEDLAEIGGAIADSAPERLAFAAHRLKGSAASIGAETARELAASLETAAKRGSLEGARESLGALERAVAAVERVSQSGPV